MTVNQPTVELECEHPDFEINASVGRMSEVDGGPITHYSVEATVRCTRCERPFQWVGPAWGIVDPNGPLVNLDGTKLYIPIEPKGERMRGRISVGARLTDGQRP